MIPKILIVDGSPATRSFIRAYLSFQTCELLEADNGERALQIARLIPIDLVIGDIAMTGVDGIALVKALRARPERTIQKLPVILFGTDRSPETERRAVRAGANHYLGKPLDPVRLGECVRGLIGPAPRQSPVPGFSSGT